MDAVLGEIKEIAQCYTGIRRVVLFGSRARGDANSNSDYDLAVFSDNENHNILFRDALENVQTLNKLDVVFISKRHKETELYRNILRDGVDLMNKYHTKRQNYQNALARLHEGIAETEDNSSLTLRDGVIQRFEFTVELAWKTVREYLMAQGVVDINSPKPVLREAFQNQLITDETGWLKILQDRNSTSHIYDEEDAAEIFKRICTEHIHQFDALAQILDKKEID